MNILQRRSREIGAKLISALTDPKYRAPVQSDMQSDIGAVIRSLAIRYTDQSCMALHQDELEQEGWYKYSVILSKGYADRLPRSDTPTREEWFKFFKTAVNNHLRGLVHRHRGTLKRTGHRIPDKEERRDPNRKSNKPMEVSLDDDETHLQLSDAGQAEATVEGELADEIKAVLTPIERMVFQQLVEPNPTTWFLAELESYRGNKDKSSKIKITHELKAKGLGMELNEFLTVQRRIQDKTKLVMTNPAPDNAAKYNSSVRALEEAFDVQIPDEMRANRDVIARLFTMAARRESARVTPVVRELIVEVGGKAPENVRSIEACFGVMYEKGHRICDMCHVREQCQVESLTHGIDGTITYSPRLMGTKLVRCPTIVAQGEVAKGEKVAQNQVSKTVVVPAEMAPERDDEVRSYLAENFRAVRSNTDIYLRHKETRKTQSCIFWINQWEDSAPVGQLQLRFCKPSPALAEKLRKGSQKAYYLPDNVSADQAIALIEQHAKERF